MFEVYPVNPELEKVTGYTITSKCSFLRSHFEKIEDLFQDESQSLLEECERENERTKDHEDDSQVNYGFADSQREIEFIYLRMHRYSAILAAYSYLESSMNKLCEYFKEEMNIPISVYEMNGNGICRCKNYMAKLAGINFEKINSHWSNLKTLSKLRNCIVHADGDADKFRGSEKLIAQIENSKDLSFIEKNLIMVSRDFVYNSISSIEHVLRYIVESDGAKESNSKISKN